MVNPKEMGLSSKKREFDITGFELAVPIVSAPLIIITITITIITIIKIMIIIII